MSAADRTRLLAEALALAANGRVGELLSSSVPAMVLAGDARVLLFVNAAAGHVLGISSALSLLGETAPLDDAVLKYVGRIAANSNVGSIVAERIRYYRGIKPIILSLTIERLSLNGGDHAILVTLPELARPNVDSGLQATLNLYTGVDDFLTVISGCSTLAMVGNTSIREGASVEIEALALQPTDGPVASTIVEIASERRDVLLVRIGDADPAVRLVYVGPPLSAPDSFAANELDGQPRSADAGSRGSGASADGVARTSFAFDPSTGTQRVAWELDGEHRFSAIGAALAESLGPNATPRIGETWSEVAARLEIDHDGLSQKLVSKTPWHGVTVAWPAEGVALRVPVDFTGMPLINSNRETIGLRGFAVIRPGAATADPLATGLRIATSAEAGAPQSMEPAPSAVIEAEAITDVSPIAPANEDRMSFVESIEGQEAAAPSLAVQVPELKFPRLVPPLAANVDDLPANPQPPLTHLSSEALRLSGPERNAFRQIAEALGARFEGDDDVGIEPTQTGSLAQGDGRDASVRIISTQDLLERLNRDAPTETLSNLSRATERRPGTMSASETQLIDRLPLAIGLSRDETLFHANPAFLALTGYASLDALRSAGGLDAIFAGPQAAQGWNSDRGRHHIPLVTQSGRVVPVDARIASIPFAGEATLLITLIASDRPGGTIPDGATLALREKLRSAEVQIDQLEAILAVASDGVLTLTADGTINTANSPAEQLFGFEQSALIGQQLRDLMAPESVRTMSDYLEGMARGGIGSLLLTGREVMGKTRTDRYIPLHGTLVRLPGSEDALFAFVMRDISRWKSSEEELTLARRRAEEASLQKSDFLAKISHEIRTPLNAIIGFSEVMLGERFGAIGVERYKDYLRDIQSSGTHIMSLINDLLDLSKVESGKLDLKFESVQLVDVLADCVQLMQPQANRARIIIRASLTQGLPPVVADQRSIRQIVLNLLSNAIKFTPAGGQVIVSAAYEETNEVVIRVRDTGYGMSPNEIDIAMEPFRQVHNGRGRNSGPGAGTGLGLPLTKALVEANRAALKIDSAVNQGTLVQVTFPAPRVLAAE